MMELKIITSSGFSIPVDSALFPELAVIRCDVERGPVARTIRSINEKLSDDLFDSRGFFEIIMHNFENLKELGLESRILEEHIEIIVVDYVGVYAEDNLEPLFKLGMKFFRALEKNKWAGNLEEVYVLGTVNPTTAILGKGYEYGK